MQLQKCSAVSLCQASVGLTSRNYTQPKQAWQGHNFTVPVSCGVLCITCAAYGKPSKNSVTTSESFRKHITIHVICKHNANQKGMLFF